MTTSVNKNEIKRSILLDVIGSVEDALWTPLQDFVQKACSANVCNPVYNSVWDSVWYSVANSVDNSVWISICDNAYGYFK